MQVALVQMVSSNNVERNLVTAEKLVRQAVAEGAKAVFLPEYFYFMGSAREIPPLAEDEGSGPIQDRIALLARELRVHILAGSLPLRVSGEKRIASGTLLFGPEGPARGRYDKMHLFDMTVPRSGEIHRESDTFRAGPHPSIVDIEKLRLGLSICYDLRFPELYRSLVSSGCHALAVPAAFTYATGKAHWHVLLRARAIENQCYVLAPDQGGTHSDGKRTFGHSLIVDPWGEILAEGPETGTAVVHATLDLEKLRNLRREFPVLDHRRL